MKQVWSGAFQRGGEADSGTDRSQSPDNPGPGSLLLFPVPVQPWCVSVLPGTLGHPCAWPAWFALSGANSRICRRSRPAAWESIFRLNDSDRRGWGVAWHILYPFAAPHASRRHRHRHLPRAIPRSLSPARVDPWYVAYMTRSFDPGPCFMLPWLRYHRSRQDSIRFLLLPPDAGSRMRPWPPVFTGTGLPFTSFTSRVYPPHQNHNLDDHSPPSPARRRCAGLSRQPRNQTLHSAIPTDSRSATANERLTGCYLRRQLATLALARGSEEARRRPASHGGEIPALDGLCGR